MEMKNEIKSTRKDPNALRIAIMFLSCTIIYYLPSIIGMGGGTSAQNILNSLHNFYGLDFYALLFFVPVVYAAYSAGVYKAILVAFASMVVFLPYSLFVTDQPGTFFRPTAFVLILSAVGAVVAMLQRGDEQRHRSMNELKCLYEIGKLAEKNESVESFITSIGSTISQNLNRYGEVEVSLTLRDKVYGPFTPDESKCRIKEDLIVGGEVAGRLEIAYPRAYSWDKKTNHFIKTLAERIGGAIHSIELEQSLRGYYEQLEVMVENRTRELEQAQEKLVRSERLVAVGELASGVGHELRNPLNVIRNCVYLINLSLDGKAPPEVEDSLKLLDLQVDISNKIVSDLLDFTRVKMPNRAIVDLNSMVKDRIAWASVPEKVRVVYNLSHESPSIYIDAEQVGRAFTNIINNAVQAIGSSGELRVSTGIEDNLGWIKFTDTGCGIKPENLNKIFEPLFTTRPKGIGLGLAITRRMVEQNGGEIAVESAIGVGTTFTIKLPLIKTEVIQYETAGQHSGRG